MDNPWVRVRQPAPIPHPLTVQRLEELPDAEFTELLRSHLLPPSDARGPQRKAWVDLWAILTENDALADRAFDALEAMIDTTEVYVEEAGEDASPRARRFIQRCEDALDRLEAPEDHVTLRRTSVGVHRYEPAARPVVAGLVQAIVDHRAAIAELGADRHEDRWLWRALGEAGLDPEASTPPPEHPHRRRARHLDRKRLALFNLAARIDIRHLVGAITAHRDAVLRREPGYDADHELWSVLATLELEQSRTDEEN